MFASFARRLAAAAAAACLAAAAPAADAALPPSVAVPGEILVKYRPLTTASQRAGILAAVPGAARLSAYRFIDVEHVRVPAAAVDEALATLRAQSAVAYAEPNFVIRADVVPNDTSFPTLWNMLNTGQSGAFAGDDIDATLAWDLQTGDPSMKVGVVDTGIDYTHPDLAANIWTNPGEIPDNGIDDDANGYVDDVHGYDFCNHDPDPFDDNFHGTHVAGTIGAAGNNALGVAGVAWHCQLVAIKFMNATGYGAESDAIAALEYARAVGVRLTNNSWGNMSGGQALLDAIDACGAAGQLFVCAAGNNGWNIDAVPVYPACYASSYILTVAATDGRDLRPTFSNYGAATVDLGAPGYNIYSCKPGGLYQSLNGTSMAAPHVTGAAMLAFARFPHASLAQIRQLILDGVDPVASMAGRTVTGGRLNAYKSLLLGDATPPAVVSSLAVVDSGASTLTLAWTAPGDDGAAGTAARYDLRYSTAPLDSLTFASATPVTVAGPQPGGSAELALLDSLPAETTLYCALRTIDDFGNQSALSNLAVGRTHAAPVGLAVPASPVAPDLCVTSAGAGGRAVAVRLTLPATGDVTLQAFDVRGRSVATLLRGVLPAGARLVRWDSRDDAGARLAPGVYLLRARVGAASVTRRVAIAG